MDQQTVDPTPPAASSPAPVTGQAVMDNMTDTQRDTWQKTGDLPETVTIAKRAKSDATPDSSSAKPVDQAPDAKPASSAEPAKTEKRAAPNRNQQLDTEIADLKDKLKIRHALREELASSARTPDAAPASSPAATPAEFERYLAMPGAPKEEHFDSIAKFTAAMGLFIADARFEEHQQRSVTDARVRAHEERVRGIGEQAVARIAEAKKADPDFESKVNPDLLDVVPASVIQIQAHALRQQGHTREADALSQSITAEHALADLILESPHTDKLLLHFSTTDGAQSRARMLAAPNRSVLEREFGRLEGYFAHVATSPAAPAAKHVSSAPSPATVLGTRTADAADPEAAAVRDKDFTRYEREANARVLASLR